MDDCYYGSDTKFKLLQWELVPSRSISSQFIEIDLFFKPEYRTYILHQDHRLQQFEESIPCWYDQTSAAVAVVGESLSCDDIRAAVGEAIGGRVLGDKREDLIGFACEQVRKRFPTEILPAELKLDLHLSFDVRIVHVLIYAVESDRPRMVPAADSSFALLEKYEVDRVRAGEEERSCCICLEELAAGGGALRMPCSHVFHGGCIKEWLTTSHYCPLCRYEMPTE